MLDNRFENSVIFAKTRNGLKLSIGDRQHLLLVQDCWVVCQDRSEMPVAKRAYGRARQAAHMALRHSREIIIGDRRNLSWPHPPPLLRGQPRLECRMMTSRRCDLGLRESGDLLGPQTFEMGRQADQYGDTGSITWIWLLAECSKESRLQSLHFNHRSKLLQLLDPDALRMKLVQPGECALVDRFELSSCHCTDLLFAETRDLVTRELRDTLRQHDSESFRADGFDLSRTQGKDLVVRQGLDLLRTQTGDLVDPDALVAALDSGHVAGAALDVFAPEPIPAGHPILGRSNVILAPHVASVSAAAVHRLRTTAAELAVAALQGGPLPSIVNGLAGARDVPV